MELLRRPQAPLLLLSCTSAITQLQAHTTILMHCVMEWHSMAMLAGFMLSQLDSAKHSQAVSLRTGVHELHARSMA